MVSWLVMLERSVLCRLVVESFGVVEFWVWMVGSVLVVRRLSRSEMRNGVRGWEFISVISV